MLKPRAVAIALAAVLVFAAVVAAVEWRRNTDLSSTASARSEIERAAATFGAALFTYDYRHLPADQSRVLALATPTGPFATGERRNAARLDANIAAVQAVGTAVVDAVYAGDRVGRRAGAFVVVDTSVKAASGTSKGFQYVQLVLVDDGDQWKVDAVTQFTNPAG